MRNKCKSCFAHIYTISNKYIQLFKHNFKIRHAYIQIGRAYKGLSFPNGRPYYYSQKVSFFFFYRPTLIRLYIACLLPDSFEIVRSDSMPRDVVVSFFFLMKIPSGLEILPCLFVFGFVVFFFVKFNYSLYREGQALTATCRVSKIGWFGIR